MKLNQRNIDLQCDLCCDLHCVLMHASPGINSNIAYLFTKLVTSIEIVDDDV